MLFLLLALMNYHRLSVICTLLLYTLLPLSAQASEWKEYASASSVRDIAREGKYLWLVTTTGIVKFDTQTLTGKQYTQINSGIPTILYMSSIAVDNNRVKWIGTFRGLVRYDDTDWTLYNTSNTPLTSSNILEVVVSPDNSVWLSTPNEVARFSNNVWKVYAQKDFPCLKSITSLYTSPDGSVWTGRSYAQQPCQPAYVLRNDELLPVSNDFTNREVQSITGSNSMVWFATNAYQIIGGNSRNTGALVSYDGTESQSYQWNEIGFTDPTTLTSVSADNAGGVWVLGPNSNFAGVAHFDGTTWSMFNSDNSPLNQNIRMNMLMADDNGGVWIATENRGLLRYDGTQWKEFPYLGLSNPPLHHISSFAVDTDRSIWGCYYSSYEPVFADSCVHFTEQGWTHQALPVGSIEQIVIDREGTRWIRDSWGKSLYRYKNGAWEQMRNDDSIYRSTIYINRKNEVWTSQMERFDGHEWTVPAPEDLRGDCSAITEDRHGTMWFGTSRGLVAYDGTIWTRYPREPQDMVDGGAGTLVMTCDSADNIWLGSNGFAMITKGLHKFSKGQWYTQVGPVGSTDMVSAVTTDCTGNVWVSSNKLFRFDGNEWTTFDNTNSPLPSAPSQLIVDAENTVWMTVSTGIMAYRQGASVSVQETRNRNTTTSALAQNYPNPATASTSIVYEIPQAAGQQQVQLTLWNALGMPVATLVDAVQAPGSYTVKYNTEALPAGAYYYQLQSAGTTVSRQMIVVH